MKGDELPDDSHVVRYAKPTLVREDRSVGGEAFQLRPGEESSSAIWPRVSWLGSFFSFAS